MRAKAEHAHPVTDITIRPQKGPQEAFLSSPADIAIYGGAAGGGKTFGLLLDPLRYISNPKFGGCTFRRTVPEIIKEGGLWDEANNLYPLLGAKSNQQKLDWRFPVGARFSFSHMQYEKDRFRWQGAQLAYIGWDELTHFTWKQWNYMFSRNRTTCGVKPCQRATCNPDPDHWLRKVIAWWINEETGFPIRERSGKLRYFVLVEDELIWADRPGPLRKKYKREPKSLTFIPAKVTDNKILLEKNPEYLSNLDALDKVQRARLKDGNWNIRYAAGMLFKRNWFEIVEASPAQAKRARFWDRAATEPSPSNPDPDWTVGIKLAKTDEGMFFIEGVDRFRHTPGKRDQRIKNIASQDGDNCTIGLFQDPGQAGKAEAQYLSRFLAGFSIKLVMESTDKITKASPVSAQAETGNIKLVRGPWNEEFLRELEQFPEGAHDDQVDALSGGFYLLTERKRPGIGIL
jgi:predicted phage terminase large subunit-like protein